ncbi:MAG: LLM class flavin-dependent oxidoreductase [Pseudomonadota bacterium]
MKLGIYINSQHPGDQDPARKFDEMIEQVRLMRQHSFDSLWAGEHHAVPPYHYFPLLGMLQRLSAEAEGMYLGTNIVLLPLHNPLEIAELGAFLDVLSGGKFILGVGLGYRQAEFDMFKVPIKQRVSRMVEGIEVIRRLWTEDNVSHKGRYWQLDDVTIRPQPLNKPSPPILIGAQVDASIKRAAEIADGWCIVPSVSTDKLTSEMEMFKSARTAAGKPETDQLVRLYEVVCAPDEETALKRATPYLLAKYESYAQWGMAGVAADPSDTPEVQLQKLAKNRFAVGSPAQLIEAMVEQYRIGVRHLTMRVSWPGMQQEHILESIDLLGREVLPEVRRRVASEA